MDAPRAATADDERRARDLRRMKARATALLVLATVVFFAMRALTDGEGWAGYVETAAEAAMVGGLADWFAVTALFRHPLGLPIPHTAIIPERKDQIGESLGVFVQENFLDGDTIAGRVHEAEVARRLGHWLRDPANAARVGDQLGATIRGVGEVLSDDEVSAAVQHALVSRAREVDITPAVGRAIELGLEGGHHHAAMDATLVAVRRLVQENAPILRRRLAQESPWWVPESIDDRVFAKITSGVDRFIDEVLQDPNHEIRAHVERRSRDFAARLAESPELQAKGEKLKDEFLDHPEVQAWFASLWVSLKAALLDAAEDPNSDLRRRVERGLVDAGERLVADADLQAKVDRWLASGAAYLARQSQGEVADLIASTVARWDTAQTSRRIELQVGRDLQFIRINGTVVGALAGLVIHAVAQFV